MVTNLVGRTISYETDRVIVGEIVLVSLGATADSFVIMVRERGGGALRLVPLTALSTVAIDPPEAL